MALDKVIDSALLDAGMQATADAIREKTGSTDPIVWDSANGFKTAVEGIQAGGGDDGSFKAVIEGTAVNPTLPADLTKIRNSAFYEFYGLELISIPAGVTSIGRYAFCLCDDLTKVTFNGKPTSIGASVFQGCNNLLTINVPWAEGEVEGSPWGARFATINYDYTGG